MDKMEASGGRTFSRSRSIIIAGLTLCSRREARPEGRGGPHAPAHPLPCREAWHRPHPGAQAKDRSTRKSVKDSSIFHHPRLSPLSLRRFLSRGRRRFKRKTSRRTFVQNPDSVERTEVSETLLRVSKSFSNAPSYVRMCLEPSNMPERLTLRRHGYSLQPRLLFPGRSRLGRGPCSRGSHQAKAPTALLANAADEH